MAGMIFLSGCSDNPITSPTDSNPTKPINSEITNVPTELGATPTSIINDGIATATEQPILPCNITFDSDRDGNLEIYTMAPDGTNQVNLTNHPADDFDPVWSPDGSQIAFISNRGDGELEGQFIFIMASDGTDVEKVSLENNCQHPDWSPLDGKIVYSSNGDIYLIDMAEGIEVNLTHSPDWDEQPKFSPDGQNIAWLKEEKSTRQIFIMDLKGENVSRVTNGGNVEDIDWTIDGRLFTHWSQPDGVCFNCVVTTDGSQVIDAGGKGTIQEFLPFWTNDGERVELVSGDISGTGFDDILLVSEIFPDLFFFLTSTAGNNRNPDTAAMCGPYHGADPNSEKELITPESNESQETKKRFVIGYTGSINPIMQFDFDQACSELNVECIHGESVTDLADMGVDAIVNASNRWDIMGGFPQFQDITSRGIPLFMLNAESDLPGVYNLSAENHIYTGILSWMMDSMNGQGDLIYYNFGNSDYIQQIVDTILKDYPDISSDKYAPNYGDNPFSGQKIQTIIAQNPNLYAIWSSESSTDLFWAITDDTNNHQPLFECPSRQDILEAWQSKLETGSEIQCISYVRPGGTAYEGIYVAYYFLSGYTLNPETLSGDGHNTLQYQVPEISNETLAEWLNKLDTFRVGDNELLFLYPMSPEEILNTWFIN